MVLIVRAGLGAMLVFAAGPGCGRTLDPSAIGIDSDTFASTTATGSATDATATEPPPTTGPTTTIDPTVTTGPTTNSTSPTDPTATTGPPPGWPEPEPFGDDVAEADLVGAWTMPWEPAGQWASTLMVEPDGTFAWRETSADCSSETWATGSIWVQNRQLMLHVERWDRPLPWRTEEVIGMRFDPPFRLRMGFTVLGPYLGVAGPSGLTATEPYTGRTHVQFEDNGPYLSGFWVAEAELWAIPEGELFPVVVVRDRFEAHLDPPVGDATSSTGIRSHRQTYYYPDPPQAVPTIFDGGNWEDLDPGNQSGAAILDSNQMHTYGPSYGNPLHLMTWQPTNSWRKGVQSPCP